MPDEYPHRKLEADVSPAAQRTVTADDWQRAAEVFADLADPAVMAAAWDSTPKSDGQHPDLGLR